MGRRGRRSKLARAGLVVAGVAALIWVPTPSIPGACVSVKNALVVLCAVLYLGRMLYDTLFLPRPRP